MTQIYLEGITLHDLNETLLKGVDEKLANLIRKSEVEEQEYLTRKELAKKLSISLPTLHDWVKKNILRAYRIGNRVYFKKSEIDSSLKPINK
jgi:excisionase family DNA binding protein